MHKRLLPLLLTAALCGSLLSTTALAADIIPTGNITVEKPLNLTDPEGTVSFANLARRTREHNLNLLSLSETIASIETLDYDKMYEDLRDNLNNLADIQWKMHQYSQIPGPDGKPLMEFDSYAYAQLEQAYSAMESTFRDIKEGNLQKDNADLVWQLRSAQDQVVMGAEALYTALAGLELQESSLVRSLAALDRTVSELELRYQLGQVSALQLQQAASGRTTMTSGLATLRMNIKTLKMQLEQMVGAPLTGTISLAPLPEVQPSQVTELDQEAGLTAAKEKSYQLYAAGKTLADAEETYKDAADEYNYNEKKYQFVSARHTWQAAQYTHDATVQNFEMNFRTLYLKVLDYQQALEAARVSLETEQRTYAAQELKFQQGAISKNALLDAQDKVTAADESVQSAAIDLFSAYHTYNWAVSHGILN